MNATASESLQQAALKLDEMCARWNVINVQLDDMDDSDADAAFDEMQNLNSDIRKQRAKVYRLAKREGVVLPGSRRVN